MVHLDGEVDTRGCYTAIAVAHILNLDKEKIAERSGMVDFIKGCQSFEGGLGGEPGNEAHGGYTFCGLAALVLLDRVDGLQLTFLIRWLVRMQGSMEGGFMGRTHKLVDGCYSYWQGAIFSLLKDSPVLHADLWRSLVPASLEVTGALHDLPMYETEIAEFSSHEEAKAHGEKKLRKRAEELGLDLEEGLKSLVRQPSPGTAYGDRLREELFRSTFDECQATIQVVDVSFAEVFRLESQEREELPITQVEKGEHEELFDSMGLQFWVLVHCQVDDGGLRDKPHKKSDLYHTCYCLSGLAAAQQCSEMVLGPEENTLATANHVLNVEKEKADAAMQYFRTL